MSTSRRSAIELQRVELFSPENPDGPDVEGVASYLENLFPSISILTRRSVLIHPQDELKNDLAERMARARVKDVSSANQSFEPLLGEIDYESRALRGKVRLGGIVYDGRLLQDLLMTLLGREVSPERAAIVFTDRLVSTYSHDDLRHHLRTVTCGLPSIVSVPGIVEAPARPREYYIAKQKMESEGAGDLRIAELKKLFRGKFLDHGDDGTVEVLKGLALQALFFHLTLEPFCDDRKCRLFNAHWQEDLIASQIRSGKLCKKHASQLETLAKSPVVSWA